LLNIEKKIVQGEIVMALYKLADFDADYKDSFEGNDIKGLGVYVEGSDEKIGSVNDALVDEEGHFRYLIVDLGFWIFGKKVLLPVGRSRIDYNVDRVYAVGMSRQQADELPEFSENLALDHDYEEKVRGVYRNPNDTSSYAASTGSTASLDATAPLDASLPLDATTGLGTAGLGAAGLGAVAGLGGTYQPATAASESRTTADTPTYNRDSYSYKNEPSLYDMNDTDHQTLRLYEERLVANKRRQKTGEVAIGKHVETETARVSVPVEKERVVIERVTPTDAGRTVSPDAGAFREGEVAHMEIYEETADITKEAFVREEVRVSKVIDHDNVESQEQIRREELDVNAPGLPIDER
jgi:uncharacterized protein (TIGR02271 family)